MRGLAGRPGAHVAAGDERTRHLVVSTRDGAVVASLVDDTLEDDSVFQLPRFTLDTAASRGPDGARAFGVRRDGTIVDSRVVSGSRVRLNLYTLDGATLRRVLTSLPVEERGGDHACEDCPCGSSEMTRTVWNDAKHRLMVRTTRKSERSELRRGRCVTTKKNPAPTVETLTVKDGVFVVPEKMAD